MDDDSAKQKGLLFKCVFVFWVLLFLGGSTRFTLLQDISYLLPPTCIQHKLPTSTS